LIKKYHKKLCHILLYVTIDIPIQILNDLSKTSTFSFCLELDTNLQVDKN